MALKDALTKIAAISIALYVIFGLILFSSQRSMIYYPDRQDFFDCPFFDDHQIREYNGTRFYYLESSADEVIIYYHGNAGSACDRGTLRPFFENFGWSVIFAEYAGYSDDKRRPSKELIFEDVRNINSFVDQRYGRVTIYGQSIGSGAASYHAAIGDVDTLILVAPFSSLKDVAQSKIKIYPVSLLLTENYDNIRALEDYEGRVIIFHGDADHVIPYRFSLQLFEKIEAQQKEYFLIEGKGHNDIWESAYFRDELAKSLVR